jgi:hypothetical protein
MTPEQREGQGYHPHPHSHPPSLTFRSMGTSSSRYNRLLFNSNTLNACRPRRPSTRLYRSERKERRIYRSERKKHIPVQQVRKKYTGQKVRKDDIYTLIRLKPNSRRSRLCNVDKPSILWISLKLRISTFRLMQAEMCSILRIELPCRFKHNTFKNCRQWAVWRTTSSVITNNFSRGGNFGGMLRIFTQRSSYGDNTGTGTALAGASLLWEDDAGPPAAVVVSGGGGFAAALPPPPPPPPSAADGSVSSEEEAAARSSVRMLKRLRNFIKGRSRGAKSATSCSQSSELPPR